jgi:heme-degrading monooxygenase HmoA
VISRHWTGVARPGRSEDYVRHLERDTFPKIAAIPGFVRATILRREVEDGTEFRIVTVWESMAAVAAFAGEALDVAVVPEAVRAMMVRYDERVAHYEVVPPEHARRP